MTAVCNVCHFLGDNSGGGDSSVEGDSGGSNRSRRSGAIRSVTAASPNRRWSIAHNMTGSYTAGMTYSGAATPKSPRAGASTCFCSGGLDYETGKEKDFFSTYGDQKYIQDKYPKACSSFSAEMYIDQNLGYPFSPILNERVVTL